VPLLEACLFLIGFRSHDLFRSLLLLFLGIVLVDDECIRHDVVLVHVFDLLLGQLLPLLLGNRFPRFHVIAVFHLDL
jgi:hypothetical protein